MKSRARTRFALIIVAATGLTTGCGTLARTPNPTLEEARAMYQRAERDPLIASKAPQTLEEARQSLQQTERLWKRYQPPEIVDHYAYLTKQDIAIARATAQVKVAEGKVDEMREQRQELLLKLRTRQVELVRQQAKARAREAENARQQAQAQARATELARQQAEQHRREAAMARQQAAEHKLEAELAQLQASATQTQATEVADQPTELQVEQTERGMVLTLDNVLFDFGKGELKAGTERTIDRLRTFLKKYPGRNVLIEAFTDDIGADVYNENLSKRRAHSVREALVRQGIDPERIKARGYGERYPIASNDTAAGRQQNRRIEVVVSDGQGRIPERTN